MQGDEEDDETAADKRLRLAKAYLANLRSELATDAVLKKSNLSDDEDEDDNDEDGTGTAASFWPDLQASVVQLLVVCILRNFQ